MGTIVVGVDGSEAAQAALRFAAREAALRGSRLRVVTAWHVPALTYAGGLAPPVGPERLEEAAATVLGESLGALGKRAEELDVESRTRRGRAAEVLLHEAEGAELLVVGSRGLGGFSGLLLGSVSQQCAAHAPCPVVIVRGADPGAG